MIKFVNIKSGEVAVAENEPHIAALWSSSDHSPNITQGQDFGWRLAPEIVVELKTIKQDVVQLSQLAARIGKPMDDITEPDILAFISTKYDAANAPIAHTEDYQDAYDQEVRRRMQEAEAAPVNDAPAGPKQESLEDLERRVALEERLAAARAVPAATDTTTTTTEKPLETTTTTTVAPTTTTTTTEKPDSTTTTTKKS